MAILRLGSKILFIVVAPQAFCILVCAFTTQCGQSVNECGQAVENREVIHGLSTRSEGHSCFVHTEFVSLCIHPSFCALFFILPKV